MNVDGFKAEVGALAPANLYKIIFPNLSYFASLGRGYQYLATEVSIPGQSIKELSNEIWGYVRTLAGGLDYDNVSITFECDHEFKIHKGFLAWQDDIYDKDGQFVKYYNDYTKDIGINIYNTAGKMVYQITLEDAFPKDVGSLDLSYNNESTAATFSVGFEYYKIS